MCLRSFICCGQTLPSKKPVPRSAARAESLSNAKERAQSTVSEPILPQPTVTETATAQGNRMPQKPAIANDLLFQVDDMLGACPRFRILLVGKSGLGLKSTLITEIFNISKDKTVAHASAGRADIEYEYTSPENPRFILHDSMGLESGYKGDWENLEIFIEKRQGYGLPEKIHALWFCAVRPRTGARLLDAGDEKVLQLANKFDIPIIAVFTKYDPLVSRSMQQDSATAGKEALPSFDLSVKDFQEELVRSSIDPLIPCVKISMREETSAQETLIKLTNLTRDKLKDVEPKLEILWVAAQQVNARQKVEVSIGESFKKYRLDLIHNSVFEDQILMDCIHRLHEDVLKVWNFNDPTEVLSGINFFTEMIGLVNPLIEKKVDKTSFQPGNLSTSRAKNLVSLLERSGFSFWAIDYLYDVYKPYPSTAKILAIYIANLVLVLHGIFTDTLPSDPPRELSDDVVFKAVDHHKTVLKKDTLDTIDLIPEFANNPEQVIEREVKKRLPPDLAGAGAGTDIVLS